MEKSELSDKLILYGLGIFFLFFGIIKITDGDFFINGPYQTFYGTSFSGALIIFIGLIQILMAVAFFTNKYVNYVAWLAVIMNLSTIYATRNMIFGFFNLPPAEGMPPGFLFFAVIPIFLMSLSVAIDKKYSNGKKLFSKIKFVD